MENLYYVYAIKSQKDNRIYVGFSRDANKRLQEHNNGLTKSTKGFRPWELVFCEKVHDRKNAREREKFLKSGYGKELLKITIKEYSTKAIDCNIGFRIENHKPVLYNILL